MMRVEHIGMATLYQGDATAILPAMEGIDTLVTDPPYGMQYRSKQAKHRVIANDDTTSMLEWALRLDAAHSKYVFCRWDNLAGLPPDIALPTSMITWLKNNWTAGDTRHAHARQSEVILFYPGVRHFFPLYRPSDFVAAARTANDNHPTEKPVDLMDRIVGWTDGTVVDPFMGSGTTGVSCARLGRPFIGIELDAQHFETACRRIAAAHAGPRLPPPVGAQNVFGAPRRKLRSA